MINELSVSTLTVRTDIDSLTTMFKHMQHIGALSSLCTHRHICKSAALLCIILYRYFISKAHCGLSVSVVPLQCTHRNTHAQHNDTICCTQAKSRDSLRMGNSWLPHLAGSTLLVRYGLMCTGGTVS